MKIVFFILLDRELEFQSLESAFHERKYPFLLFKIEINEALIRKKKKKKYYFSIKLIKIINGISKVISLIFRIIIFQCWSLIKSFRLFSS